MKKVRVPEIRSLRELEHQRSVVTGGEFLKRNKARLDRRHLGTRSRAHEHVDGTYDSYSV